MTDQSGEPEALTVADDALPFFTARQADRFRAAVGGAFVAAGLDIEIRPDHVVDTDGRVFGLSNVAAACHNAEHGEPEWPRIVGNHVTELLAALDEPSAFETLSPAEIIAATFPRLLTSDSTAGHLTYDRPVAPGLTEALNLDLPTTVAWFTDTHVERFGRDELFRAARANLRSVEVDDHETIGDGDATVHVLLGESMFVATLLLRLPEIVARYDGPADPDRGVLAAVPNRHQLAFHALRATGGAAGLDIVAGVAAMLHQDGGDLTPDVYWWRPGGIERVTELTADGPRYVASPALGAVLDG